PVLSFLPTRRSSDLSRVVFFCFEALRFPGQKATLELLNRAAPEKTVACLIRSSWDARLLHPRMTVVDARGYRLCQLGAAVKKMRSEEHTSELQSRVD